MRQQLRSVKQAAHLHPLALAAAMLMAAQAQAQVPVPSFTQSGANSTTGNPSGLPFVGDPASLNFGTDTIYIANSAPGSFAALSGAQLTAGALSIANGGVAGSVGSVTFDGVDPSPAARTTVLLGGSGNRVEVGNWGTGTLTVSGSALLDAASAACAASCGSFIGNGAGSTATLNISGAGSEVRTLGTRIGQSSVFTNPPNTFFFGTPGGETKAFVNIEAGGTLRTRGATVGGNNAGPNGAGTERANGEVVVDGIGSKWVITPNGNLDLSNPAAGLTIGNNVRGEGTIEVRNGGKLLIDGSTGTGPNDFLNIGSNGGKGTLTVTGAGSGVDVVGVNTLLQVGRSGAGAQDSFSVLAGATASALYVNVGRDGASGKMLIDGIGSKLSQVGVGSNQAPGLNGPAYTHIGRDGGLGLVTVSGGGEWLISQGPGGDGTVSGNGLGMGLGRGANSSGTLLITGAGSKVEIVSTSINPGVGVGDNRNPSVDVGYDTPGTSSGTLRVENGGKLVLTGNAALTQANGRTTALNIGGRSDTAAAGTATVTGAGSEIIVQGNDALINVGREAGGNGTLNVLAGAKVSSTSLVAGVSGTGKVNIDNASIVLSGNRTNTDPLVGAASTFGRGVGGDGTLDMKNGASFTITPSVSNGGLGFGGDTFLPGGTGKLTMSGASSILLNGDLSGNTVTIGRTGIATATLDGASSITVTNGNLYVAREVGSIGTLVLNGNSLVNAGFVGVGVSAPGIGNALGAPGGTGKLVLNDSTIKTSRFELGVGSELTGNNGVIDAGADGPVVIGGTIRPGSSPGRLRVKCDITMLATSKLYLEINDKDGGPGVDFDIDELIIGDDSKFDLTSLQIIFSFMGNTNPNEFAASEGGFSLDRFLLASSADDQILGGLSILFGNKRNPDTLNWGQAVNSQLFAFESSVYDVSEVGFDPETGQIDITASAKVPEPASFALVLLALAALTLARRRRAALPR